MFGCASSTLSAYLGECSMHFNKDTGLLLPSLCHILQIDKISWTLRDLGIH